mgnify:CR=1 FL=1
MTHYVKQGGLQIAEELHTFIVSDVLPELEIDAAAYWSNLESLLTQFAPKNRSLLAKRDAFQLELDNYHRSTSGRALDQSEYERFLRRIGYLEADVEPFEIETTGVDDEIASIAGPQLVVPIMNARFALNAANARWGSLFDALYGTDLIEEGPGTEKGKAYNPARGELVIQRAAEMLDDLLPLATGSHSDVTHYGICDDGLVVRFEDQKETRLKNPDQYVGYQGTVDAPDALLFVNHGLHVEIQIDPNHHVGRAHKASVKDVVLESAITTIQDCEDSVAAVDAEDKTLVYRNWLGLMRGDLCETFEKDGQTMTREMAPDRVYTHRNGHEWVLPGRSLLLIRNVGHLMTSDAVLLADGSEAPEGILDGYFSSTIAKYNLEGKTSRVNSRTGSVYIVKPKKIGRAHV